MAETGVDVSGNRQPTTGNTARGQWRDGWFILHHDVIFRDIDVYGHVNNAVSLTYFEIARTELWFAITGVRDASAIGFIVARAEVDFRVPLVLETIEIRTRISEMRASSFDFVYEIRKEDGQLLAVTGKTVVVLFDWETNSKRPIPDDLREKVKRLQEG